MKFGLLNLKLVLSNDVLHCSVNIIESELLSELNWVTPLHPFCSKYHLTILFLKLLLEKILWFYNKKGYNIFFLIIIIKIIFYTNKVHKRNTYQRYLQI